MSVRTALGAAIICLLFGTTSASAVDGAQKLGLTLAPQPLATEYGNSLPPVGFVQFCATPAGAEECKPLAKVTRAADMSPQRWNLVFQVNTYVNNKIAPVSDQDLYGEAEHWAYPVNAGDCEDYVLLKKRYLEGLGFAADDLRITVVLDEAGAGHAVLTLTTASGDFILDNRRNDVLLWSDTKYKFLKRQSAANPMQWMALIQQETKTSGFVATKSNR
jgi:predicted transglutaminase-like cysteine proteinase